MRARIRDVVAVAVLVVAAVAAVLAWHPLGRWPALLIALGGIVVAAAVYRARPSAFPLRGSVLPLLAEEPPLGSPTEDAPSTRRPS